MRDEQLLRLIAAVGEACALDEATSDSKVGATSACLPMSRLHALVWSSEQPHAAEAAHLADCTRCTARLAAFQNVPLPAPARHTAAARQSRLTSWQRWERAAVAIVAAAACIFPTIRSNRPQNIAGLSPQRGRPAVRCVACDANCDGVLNIRDLDAFVLAIVYPAQYVMDFPMCDILCSADANRNCSLDDADFDSLVACVSPRAN